MNSHPADKSQAQAQAQHHRMNSQAQNSAPGQTMDPQLLNYYEAIERASADMLAAARGGHWDEVLKLEGACVLLISQLKSAAMGETPGGAAKAKSTLSGAAGVTQALSLEAAKLKSRIMQRILVNDAEIRHLAEPWLKDLDDTMHGRRDATLH
jgi:flagellar protein FliT